uniref:Avirulence protein-like protein n=1 Tax=Hyaloperonospora arabidopsidis (strain Emoy2) TaxID=559515 RepID=M4C3S8_HYAAE
MANKSEKSHSIVHLVPLRDVADHRNDVSVNQSLRAQAAPGDEERVAGSSAVKMAMDGLEAHAKLRTEGKDLGEHFEDWMKRLSQRELVNGVVSNFGADESAEQALVKKLVDVYGDNMIGPWIARLSLAEKLTSGEERIREILTKHWAAEQSLGDMITLIRASEKFEDVDFYRPGVVKLLQKFTPTAVNEAIMAGYGKSEAYFVSVLYRATMKEGSDLAACEAAWQYYRWRFSEEWDTWKIFKRSYLYHFAEDIKKFVDKSERSYDILMKEQMKRSFDLMQTASKVSKLETFEGQVKWYRHWDTDAKKRLRLGS